MTQYLFTDNAITTLAAPISSVATSLQVVSGAGALFPFPGAGQQFTATLVSATNPLIKEIILCTNRVGDTFNTILRGQEGTTATSWNAGDGIYHAVTAGALNSLGNAVSQQTQSGNYAQDFGTSSAYSVTLNPPLTAHVVGMPIRFRANNTNFAGATFNDGAGVGSMMTPDGLSLLGGIISGQGIYTVIWDGAQFQLQWPEMALYARLLSPNFTGLPTGPTAAAGTSTNQLATTAFVNQGSLVSGAGYLKFPNGIILQWGITTLNSSSPAAVTTFPIAFPGACFSITVTPLRDSDLFVSNPAASTSTFSVTWGNQGTQGCWQAIGH